MDFKAVAVLLVALSTASCGDSSETKVEPLSYDAALSDCGGFETKTQRSDYCAAEIAKWEYDHASKTLVFSDNRIMLNCCGEHDITVRQDGDVYAITEHDAPEQTEDGGQTRCKCTCPFDYQVELKNMPSDIVEIRLLRNITDDDQWTNALVWEGTLDLTEESGEIVIDDTPVAFACED